MHSKNYFAFTILLVLAFPLFSGEYVTVSPLSGASELLIKKSNGDSVSLINGSVSDRALTIITGLTDSAECLIKNGPDTIAQVVLSPATDLTISLDTEGKSIFTTRYGQVRIVSAAANQIHFATQNGSFIIDKNTDSAFSILMANEKLSLAGALFKGKITRSPTAGTTEQAVSEAGTFAMSGQTLEFTALDQEQLSYYQNVLSRTNRTPVAGVTPVLETLTLPGKEQNIPKTEIAPPASAELPAAQEEKVAENDTTTDENTPAQTAAETNKEIDKPQQKEQVYRLINFRTALGTSGGDTTNFFFRIGWYPDLTFFGSLLEVGWYVDFTMVPIQFLNIKPFYEINGNNDEWSFGRDHIDSTTLLVLDVLDDLFLKLGYFRYGYKESDLFIEGGVLDSHDDPLNSTRFFAYTPSALIPYYRENSLYITYKNTFFNGSFYSEDTLPGGLYDLSFRFMTPGRSLQISGGHSFTLDTYELRKNAADPSRSSIAPLHFNSDIAFTIFDLPSFGYRIYGNLGMLFPFSVTPDGSSSEYSSLFGSDPSLLLKFVNVNAGQQWRSGDFAISAEGVVDSAFSGISMYSPLYHLLREEYYSSLHAWYDDPSTSLLSSYSFGMRFGIEYTKKEFVHFRLFYLPMVQYENTLHYRDRFMTDLSLSTGNAVAIPVDFSLLVEWKEPVNSIINGITENYTELFATFLVSTELTVTLGQAVSLSGSCIVFPGVINDYSLPDVRGEFCIHIYYETAAQTTRKDKAQNNL